ncbi:nitroreductase family protein [Halalkalibacter krulwichiae]|uniref:Putative NAD(P)H nitroreductase YdjA n=1 Tax=Halalkalibacter krulwichiae TaxID=199441 RepID=A0A1X9MBI2_9BACI|nr:nitroreductase [Halalkalibacter krulwichiae]ARK30004.1 Putative NAD(P)H nitroreductase YdjA [Halalkalibacter krulwichiae]
MSVIEFLHSRRAIRNYQPREVEKEKIEQLLKVATLAPNDRLREPWSFYVIQGEAKKRYEQVALDYLQERFPTKPKLIESSIEVVKNTPVIIMVTADIASNKADTKDNEYAVCCAIHSMWLAACELELGFVWRTRGVGLVHDQRSYQFIGSPEGKKMVGTIFLGYPDQSETEVGMLKKRTSYEEKTVWL